MRLVFLGTPDFAVASLRALLDSSYEVVAVFTQPDRPAGRGQRLQPPPVKQRALEAGIPVYQPERIRSEENRGTIEHFSPDFLVVVAYGQILPGWLLRIPRIGPVNVHGSLLPRYRGAAPIAWAILNGDTVTGVTTMLMDEGMDTGPMLLRREVPIGSNVTAGELTLELAAVGAELLIATLDGLADKTIRPVPQNSTEATLAPRFGKELGEVDWQQEAGAIHNRIRALNPWPAAFTSFGGQKLQLLRSVPVSGAPALEEIPAPGSYLGSTSSGMLVACGGGTRIDLLEVQMESRRKISGREFAAGSRLKPGDGFCALRRQAGDLR